MAKDINANKCFFENSSNFSFVLQSVKNGWSKTLTFYNKAMCFKINVFKVGSAVPAYFKESA